MKILGFILLIVGIILGVVALNMDTTVASSSLMGSYRRVHNIGLMNDRQNYLIFSGIISLMGLILLLFGRKSQNKNEEGSYLDFKKCSQCAEKVKAEAKICRYCNYTFLENATQVNLKRKSEMATLKKKSYKVMGMGFLTLLIALVLLSMILFLVGSIVDNLSEKIQPILMVVSVVLFYGLPIFIGIKTYKKYKVIKKQIKNI